MRRLFGFSEEREQYSYDDLANRAEVVNNCGQTLFAYKYDGQGNWIERLTSHRQEQNPEFTPGSIERGEIAYYS